jgi:hypothetical protein
MNWIKNTLLVLASILVACAIIEICVRVFFPQPVRFYIADQYIKTIHKANTAVTRAGPDYHSYMKTNSQGFIGDSDFIVEKPASTTRIAALGDSFTEGYVVDYDKVYPALMEKGLNASSTANKYQVYNFGIAGTGTAHQLLTYGHYVRPYHPDLLVWQFYVGNDFADNLLFGNASSSPTDAPAVKLGFIRDILSNYFEAPRFILRRLETLQNVKKVLGDVSLVSKDLHTYDSDTGYPFLYDIYNTATSTVFEQEFGHTCALAKELAAEAKQDGVPIVAVVIPTKEELFADDWQKVLDDNPQMKDKRWDLKKPLDSIVGCLAGGNIPTINMYPVFTAALARGSARMYHPTDDHTNELGQQMIADQIVRYIRDTK